MTKKIFKKTLSVILMSNLILQSFSPFLVRSVYADDSTPSASTLEVTPTPTDTVTPTPEITPDTTPTPTIVIASDSAAIPAPEVTPTIDATPTPSLEPTPDTTPVVSSEPSTNVDSQAPPATDPTPTATPTPTPAPIVPLSFTTPVLSPSLTTDKTDYFPTDVVHISGTNFLPNTDYTLHITSANNPFVSFSVSVTSNGNGQLSYGYQLDGNYRPNYSIDALDGASKIVATYSFTDSISQNDNNGDGHNNNDEYNCDGGEGHDGHDNHGNCDNSAKITITKEVVDSQGHKVDEETPHFTFRVTGQDNFSLSNGDHKTLNVHAGSYDISEVASENYTFSGCRVVSNDNEDENNGDNHNQHEYHYDMRHNVDHQDGEGEHDEFSVNVSNGSNIKVVCTNTQKHHEDNHCDENRTEDGQCIEPTPTPTPTGTPSADLSITKSNDASGSKNPGDAVVYTITLVVGHADIQNLIVSDLLPKGFVYRAGSWSATVGGSPVAITEPVYHSPGTWDVGNVSAGQTVVLNYTADISGNEQAGTYYDTATAVANSGVLLALAVAGPSYVDTNFTGTNVNVTREQTKSQDYSVEKTVTGQVLGASTELPATGANELWLLASLLSLVFGIQLITNTGKK